MDPKREIHFLPGPEFDFDFAVNDALIFNLYSYRILIFKIDGPSGHLTSTKALKTGLQSLVKRCPPLGGVIINTEDKPGQQHGWKKARPGPGIKLVVHDLREKLDYKILETQTFPIDSLKCKEVVPISPAPITEGEAPGSVFQYTWIKGGALLTVGINHSITDGNGMNTIMGMLAEECERAQLEPEQQERLQNKDVVGIDRNLVRSLQNTAKNRPEDHGSYTFLAKPPAHDKEEEDNGPEPNISPFMFEIDPESLEKLKAAANTVNQRISTHDAISALIWRSIMLARYKSGTLSDLDTQVEFHVPTDGRRFVGLDNNYIGNMVYFVTCKMSLRNLLAQDSVPKAAALIRSALENRDRELIAGYHSLCKSLPDLRQMTFGWIPKVTTTALSIGSSWRAEQMYGANWGSAFGPVKRFRSPDVGFFGVFRGLAFICPKVPGTGSAEFQAWLEPEGWQALQEDELFSSFCSRVGI